MGYTRTHENYCSMKPIQPIVFLDYNNLTRMKYVFNSTEKYTQDEIESILKSWFDEFSLQIKKNEINGLQKRQERHVQNVINKRK